MEPVIFFKKTVETNSSAEVNHDFHLFFLEELRLALLIKLKLKLKLNWDNRKKNQLNGYLCVNKLWKCVKLINVSYLRLVAKNFKRIWDDTNYNLIFSKPDLVMSKTI